MFKSAGQADETILATVIMSVKTHDGVTTV